MQSLETPELGNSSTQTSGKSSVIQGFNPLITPKGQPLITSSTVDTALLYAMSAGLHALNVTPYQILQCTTLPTLRPTTGNDVQAPAYTTIPLVTNSIGQSVRPNPTVNQALRTSVTPPPKAGSHLSSIDDLIEQAVAKQFTEMEAMI